MGVWDRDYYRDEQEEAERGAPGFRLSATSWLTRIVLLNVALYFVDALFFGASESLMDRMALRPDTWSHPLTWWRVITAGFAHDPHQASHLIFNMFGLWMFGRRIESRVGGAEFLRYYLVALVFGSLVWMAGQAIAGRATSELPLCMGASGAVTAVVLLFVCFYPHERLLLMMIIPTPAWVVGVLIVLADLTGMTRGPTEGGTRVAYEVHLAGAALAFLYFRRGWSFGRWLPRSFGGTSSSDWSFRRSPRLRVHRGEDSDRDLSADYAALDEEADRILAKLHEHGDAALTAHDRKILEDYTRRMRQKHR